ncbi:MAG: MSMEG_0569 family flavin-dependent oxidoreductase [Cyanobacteria bacterium J06650_10]
MKTHYPVVIVGGGQAGLSVSYCLKQKGIEHIIFEKNEIASAWKHKRWDSFCLVTPNWQCTLPGYPYPGDDPHGFMQRDEIVQYVKDYAKFFQPNIKEGVGVEKISSTQGSYSQRNNKQNGKQHKYEVQTTIGTYYADQVVIATGGYHRPKRPRIAERLPQEIVQMHSYEYKAPAALPAGDVLIVGTGQSGCQIAEDLHLAGRKVHLCVGGAPRSPREYRGKDVVDWLDQLGYYDITIHDHPQKETVRTKTNHYVTGRGGGREIDLRQFATEGMQLYGKLKAVENQQLAFEDNLKQNLDQADDVAESIKHTIDKYIEENNIEAPVDPPYKPVWEPTNATLSLNLQQTDIKTVIWATGYHMNFSWLEVPAFDGKGYPTHERGVTTAEGLYFVGLPWLHTWGSGRFSGIARDAAHLADCIALKSNILNHKPARIFNPAAVGS